MQTSDQARAALRITSLLLLFAGSGARANPLGEVVRAGAANVQRDGSTLTVHQTSDRAIVGWQSFSIAPGETARFVQPSSASATLNRVTGGDPSALLGRLQANGRVYLINPNGVLVGEGARIDVGSFVASTLDVSDQAFMAGEDLRFAGDSPAGVEVLGTIQASNGDVILIARHVENAGTLRAPMGTVAIGAGSEVLLSESSDRRIQVAAPASTAESTSQAPPIGEAALVQRGAIEAARAELEAAGGNLYALAIRNDGVVRAAGVEHRDGRIVLTGRGGDVQSNGALVARNADGSGGSVRLDAGAGGTVWQNGVVDTSGAAPVAKGGAIALLGKRVAVLDEAILDASGSGRGDGGSIHLGGETDASGARTSPLADALFVGPNAQVRARAGETGGDGGSVETSAATSLGVLAAPDVGAAHGKPGNWLIDPNNLNIVAGAGNTNVNASSPFVTSNDNAQLGVNLIRAGLLTGDVTVSTGTGGANSQPGNLNFNSALDYVGIGTGRTLTLNAHNDLVMNAGISQSGPGTASLNLALNADSDGSGAGAITVNAALATGGGSATFNRPTSLNANLATSTAVAGRAGGTVTFQGPVTLPNAAGVSVVTTGPAGNGSVAFQSTIDSATAVARNLTLNAGPVSFQGAVGGTNALGTLSITSSGAVTQAQAIRTASLALLGASGSYTLDSFSNPITTLAGNAGTIRFRDDTGFAVGTVGATNGINAATVLLSSTGAVTQTQAIITPGLALLGVGGTFTLTSATNDVGTLAGNTGTLSYRDANGFAVGTVLGNVGLTTTGATTLTAAGAVTQSQLVTTPGLALLGATGSYALDTLSNPITTLAGNTATIRFRDDTGFAVGTVGATNGINATTAALLSSTGAVTQTQGITTPSLDLLGAGGTFTLNAATNNVTTLAGNTGTVSYRDTNGFAVGSVLGTNGLATSGDTTLTAGAAVTQTQGITATGLALLGAGITYTLDTVSNAITTLASNVATIRFRDDTGFAVGTVGATNGINATTAALLSSTGAVTQTQAITTPSLDLLGAGGSFTLNAPTNNVTTLAGNTGSVSYQDSNGFAVGTVLGTNGLTSSGDTTLTSGGAVTQTQALTASGLALLGAGVTYTLDTVSNPITTLAGNAGTIRFRDNTGFNVGSVGATNGLNATTAALLSSTGAVTQTQAITTPGLDLLGAAGSFALNAATNDVTTLAGNTGTVSYRDANGFDIGTVLGTAGLTATATTTLTAAGPVTQSQVVTTPGLALLGSTATYTLDALSNPITTLAGNAGTVRFRDNTGFAVGTVGATNGLNATTAALLSSTGAVTQTQAVTTPSLALLGAAGTFTLNGAANDVATLAANTGTVSYRDANGFDIGTVLGTAGLSATGTATLTAATSVTQSQLVTTPGLALLGPTASYTLDTLSNPITTLAGNAGTIRFRDDTSFAVGTVGATNGLNATAAARLSSTGAVTQTQAITTPGLSLLGAGGTFTLTSATNDVGALAGSVGTLSYRDVNGFDVGTVLGSAGLTTTGTTTLTAAGLVTQSQLVTAPGLALLGATGTYTLDALSNPITTLAGNAGTIRFRDDTGFVVGTVGATNGINAAIAALLSSTGAVTQTQAITTPSLGLLGGGGSFTLNAATNNVTTLAGNTGTVSYRDTNGFAIGSVLGTNGLTTSGNATLTAGGAVTQTQGIAASGLELLGAGVTYTLDTVSNAIATLAANVATLRFRDDTGFVVGTVGATNGINATTAALLSSTGSVTQTQAITTPGLDLLGAGGSFKLDTAANNVTTLAGNTGAVSYRDTNGFAIGTVLGTNGLTTSGDTMLNAGGAVTQTQGVAASGLELLGAGVTYTLDTVSNAIATLAANVATLRFRDDTGFAVGTVGTTNGLNATAAALLSSTGAVTQTQAVTTPSLDLLGAGGSFALNAATNDVTTLAGNTGTVSYRDANGFGIGTVLGTVGLTATATTTLTAAGPVTQSQVVTTPGLALLGTTATYTLDTLSNPITTLAGNAGTIRFRDNTGFAVGTVGATNGLNATTAALLSSTGAVTQTQAITTPGLALVGAAGNFTLTSAANDVGTLAGNTGTVSYRDANGFDVGTVLGSVGLTATGTTTLTAAGLVTQSQAVTTPNLALLGATATYTLDTLSNPITTLAGNAGTIRFRDNTGFAVGTVGATNGISATAAALLSSTGAVTQTQAITTPGLALLGAGGTFTLTSATNDVGALAGNTGTVSYRDANGFDIGTVLGSVGLATTGNTTLTAAGAVTQSQALSASGLALLGATATYTLDALSNPIGTLAGNATTIRFRDDTGFAVGTVGATNGINATTAAVLSSTGAVTQTQAITTPGLALLGAGGAFTLNAATNNVTTLAGNTGSVAYRDTNGFAVGSVLGTNGLTTSGDTTLTAGGAVTQTQGITTSGLALLGAGVTYTLDTVSNAIATLAANVATLRFRDDTGFAVGTVGATNGINATAATLLSSTGAVTQTQAITTPSLDLLGAGGSFTLDAAANNVTTLAGSTGSVSYRDTNGFAVGTVLGTNGLTTSGDTTLTAGGAVTQTQAIAASGLALLGAGVTYTLDTLSNPITTLAGNAGTVRFRDDTGFAVGSVGATNGLHATTAALLSSTGAVTQSQAITTPGLVLLGAGGSFALNVATNDVTTLAGNTGTVSYRDANGFAVGNVLGTPGITTNGAGGVNLASQAGILDVALGITAGPGPVALAVGGSGPGTLQLGGSVTTTGGFTASGGASGNTFLLRRVDTALDIAAGSGDDTLVVDGATGSIDPVSMPVTFHGQGGTNAIQITNPAAQDDIFAITPGRVQRTSGGPFRVDFDGVESLLLNAGPGNDTVQSQFLVGVDQDLRGGPQAVGDTLDFDALGALLSSIASPLLASGYGSATYAGFETVNVTNVGSNGTPPLPPDPAPSLGLGLAQLDGRTVLVFRYPGGATRIVSDEYRAIDALYDYGVYGLSLGEEQQPLLGLTPPPWRLTWLHPGGGREREASTLKGVRGSSSFELFSEGDPSDEAEGTPAR